MAAAVPAVRWVLVDFSQFFFLLAPHTLNPSRLDDNSVRPTENLVPPNVLTLSVLFNEPGVEPFSCPYAEGEKFSSLGVYILMTLVLGEERLRNNDEVTGNGDAACLVIELLLLFGTEVRESCRWPSTEGLSELSYPGRTSRAAKGACGLAADPAFVCWVNLCAAVHAAHHGGLHKHWAVTRRCLVEAADTQPLDLPRLYQNEHTCYTRLIQSPLNQL